MLESSNGRRFVLSVERNSDKHKPGKPLIDISSVNNNCVHLSRCVSSGASDDVDAEPVIAVDTVDVDVGRVTYADVT
jgi:hypothetical protein